MTERTIGHYRITAKLGEGGMGEVWKAEDLQLGRFVALKSVPALSLSDEVRRARFLREARATSALNHPNIVTIYDLVHDGNALFLVMEFVDGRTLDHLVHGRGLSLNEALRIAIPIADALAAAHKTGLVHRDLKPGNVMVREDGTVKVLDFGLVKLIEEHVSAPNQDTVAEGRTEQGMVLGTVAYMSPEQAQGKPVDGRSDIFSFGVLLYELITGRRPFASDNKASTLAAVIGLEPKPASEIVQNLPRDMDRLIQRCLRKDPFKRWQTMADLKVALEELKEESDSGRLEAGQPAASVSRTRTTLLWAGGSTLVAAGLIAALLLPKYFPTVEDRPARVVLTTYPGAETDPCLSRDGKQLTFIWDGERADNPDVYVKLVDSGEPLRLTRTPGVERQPKWSPDGSQIAFLRDTALLVIPALGGPERRVTDSEVRSFDWHPKGSTMVIGTSAGLQLFTLATGQRLPLTKPGSGQTDYNPSFSPDGESVAFVRAQSEVGQQNIMVIPATGGEAREVVTLQGFNHNPSWTADGSEIIFQRQWSALHRVSASGGNVERVRESDDFAGKASIVGTRLVYSKQNFDLNIWSVPLGAGARPQALITSTQRDFCAQISPDGKHLAFSSDRTGNWEIWTSDHDGRNQVQLTSFGNAIADGAAWSPDGTELVFSVMVSGNRDVYAITPVGGVLRRITSEPSDEGRPFFSRDGREIYFRSDRSGRPEIWKLPRTGGTAQRVTTDGGFDVQPSLDDSGLYFTTSRSKTGLWIIPPGESLAQPVQGLEQVVPGHWAASRAGIHWLRMDSDSACTLMLWNPHSKKNAETLKINVPLWSVARVLSVTPDGLHVYWHQADMISADLVLLDPFR